MTNSAITQNAPALEITNLTKTYRRADKTTHALKNVSLIVQQGECFGLLGPNGAGKSTLIGALGGLVLPDAGCLRVLGHDIVVEPRFVRMAVGIVPQEITVDPFFTVRETLAQQSGFFGLRHNDDWIDELIRRLGLDAHRDARVSRLSGGMKRRVLIAQALVHRPPVIVLDEPTAGVDVELRRRIWEFMRELNSAGHTVILTTHYLEEAQELCSRIALLNHGSIAALDTTQKLLSDFSDNRVRFRLVSGTLPKSIAARAEPLAPSSFAVAYSDATDLMAILSALTAPTGSLIEDVEFGRANLEEVFLRLTSSH